VRVSSWPSIRSRAKCLVVTRARSPQADPWSPLSTISRLDAQSPSPSAPLTPAAGAAHAHPREGTKPEFSRPPAPLAARVRARCGPTSTQKPAPGSGTTGQFMQHRRCAAHATRTRQHRCLCMHKAHTRPNLPRGRPSRALWPPTASALVCAVARAASAHLATRARRAHFDRSRGGQTHILCSAASSAALRCVRAEFGAPACHPAISRYSAGARRGEGRCRARRAPGGLGSCVRAHRRTLHGRTWLPARCRRRPPRPGRPQAARPAAISSRFRQLPALPKTDLRSLLIVARP
jgi:hypothetical protein